MLHTFFLKAKYIVYYLLGKDITMIPYYTIEITVKYLSLFCPFHISSCSNPLEFKKWRKYYFKKEHYLMYIIQ